MSVRGDMDITLYFYKGCTFSSYYAFNCLYFFADNTYVSSSENDEDVLVTTEPIPVIFHRIATGNRNTLFLCLRLIFIWLLEGFVFWFP